MEKQLVLSEENFQEWKAQLDKLMKEHMGDDFIYSKTRRDE